jgi:ribonucleotide reductase beta subunit family protein with ferritin-like domain
MNQEYMTNPINRRLTVHPINELEIWNMYKKSMASMWTPEEIDFSKDYNDFTNMSSDSQYFIKMILAFFAASDMIVNMNLTERFTNEITITEAIIAYQFQIMMENVHSETYSLQIDNIIRDKQEKLYLLNAVENFDCIKNKAQWAMKWINSDCDFVQRVVAFACVEGIFFSGSFASIFWIKKQNLMPGLCDSNELIARDEGIHTMFACLIKSKCSTILDEKIAVSIIMEAVEIEKEFICFALPCSLLGMNSTLMSQYIEYVADRLLISLGYNYIYNTINPFDFMESISLQGKTNFFESRPTQYQKASVLNTGTENIFDTIDDF